MDEILADLISQGKKFLKEKDFDKAIECFGSALQQGLEQYGEDNIRCAHLWFEYGNALLEKEETNPSDDLLGFAHSQAKEV